ncbi:NAD-dependent DNA ligase LigA [Actomonas aquatica]|uniref:DNA ligase n=1 Tax=Actomonas aquatica TaxID=2866162 RepID=A0ABZ1C1T4_9BACT|nr:NAD-dependent DNA ligase LigA [Opitutus sp. WL0086]WRQ85602.1 NAD-dependent DNA ligase LigA [Opitutus sp. WL0086]
MRSAFRTTVFLLWSLLLAGLCGFLLASIAGAVEPALAARIESLREEIVHHDELYFQRAAPEITDYEYDLLKLELRRLEQEAGMAPSEAARFGDDTTGEWPQVAHRLPMLSLDKAYTEAEVADYFARVRSFAGDGPLRFVIEPKYDGVAVNVRLEAGGLVSAATRGDGASGEEVTRQIASMRGLHYSAGWDPDPVPVQSIELRGEVYLTHDDFAALNAERVARGEEPFRHPRSVAAGAIKLEDLALVAQRRLSLVFHGWGAVEPYEATPASVSAFHCWLEERALPFVSEAVYVEADDVADLNVAIAEFARRELAYPTDGVVIKVDDTELQRRIGDGPTAPRWALARKFVPPRARTVLRDVSWQVGRTGSLTPVAEFDPVVLGGASISRASLHHAGEIRRRDLRIGDTVWIEKAGEIIPQLAGVDEDARPVDARPYALPEVCPSCGKTLRSESEDTQLVCANRACPEQTVQRLLHYTSRSAAYVRGLGPGLAHKLVAAELVRSPADLYQLESAQLIVLPGVGKRSAERLLEAIEESRSTPLRRVLVGLGLPGVGPAGAKALANGLRQLGDLLDDTTVAESLAVLGPATAADVRGVLREPAVRTEIARLADELVSP